MVHRGGVKMKFRLHTLEMRNFKVFSDGKIDVSGNKLLILGGPNGYGKTSTFDALEYVFTGNVRRIAESGISRGNLAFAEDCLIKKPSEGDAAYVEAVFVDEQGNELKITRTYKKGTGTENNPTKLKERTYTDIAWMGQAVLKDADVECANEKLKEYFGQRILEEYSSFYYIQQEDRLQFLSKNEGERIKAIEKLFGLAEENEALDKIEKARKQFDDIRKKYESGIKKKEDERQVVSEQNIGVESGQNVSYKRLIDTHRLLWDEENPKIDDKNKLEELVQIVQAVGAFSREVESYKKDLMNVWIDNITSDKKQLKNYLYLIPYAKQLNELENDMKRYYELKECIASVTVEDGSYDYVAYDYKKIAQLIGISIDMEKIETIKANISKYRDNIKGEDRARASITNLQLRLQKEWDASIEKGNIGLEESSCPLCGHTYASREELIQRLDDYRSVIENAKGDSQKLLDVEILALKEVHDLQYKDAVDKFIEERKAYENTICSDVYKFKEADKSKFKSFLQKCDEYNISQEYMLLESELDKADEVVDMFITKAQAKKVEVSDGYYESKEKYRYDFILESQYNSQIENVHVLSENDIREKVQYITQVYFGSQMGKLNAINQELNVLKEKFKQAKKIESDLKQMRTATQGKIRDYKAQLVKQLEIPFYVYTGRLLQNYPGGLGIVMNISDNGNIRFEAERRKGHDAFYTMSSGQLSATAMAIALTLNKVYSQDNIKCMFIDDPIQTMDELNVSSFVEVLRNDFPEYQFVVSTHEEDFADYIGYKYDKYDLSNIYVDAREIEKQD